MAACFDAFHGSFFNPLLFGQDSYNSQVGSYLFYHGKQNQVKEGKCEKLDSWKWIKLDPQKWIKLDHYFPKS